MACLNKDLRDQGGGREWVRLVVQYFWEGRAIALPSALASNPIEAISSIHDRDRYRYGCQF